MSVTGLDGRVYLVTGAAGGIGEGIARAIFEAGGKVALVDVDLEGAGAVARRVGMTATSSAAFRADVSDAGEVERAVEGTLQHFGRIDGAVNNAGVVTLDEAWQATGPDWNHQLEVNVTGSFLVAQAVGKRLKASGGGSIVNVASNCGKVGYRNMAAYNASKSAVLGLTRSLSMEWAEHGINVNAVCPGGVDTPMLVGVAEWLSPRLDIPADELLGSMGPAQLGRRISPVEVGRVIAFLLSDAAHIIRGQAINVDGGDTWY
ncbi:MAG: SDR family oxidoreductase [Acidimicrobiia bacterium]|nr:SDR family oxidoreductase [Acidimicrobiia bacterium]